MSTTLAIVLCVGLELLVAVVVFLVSDSARRR